MYVCIYIYIYIYIYSRRRTRWTWVVVTQTFTRETLSNNNPCPSSPSSTILRSAYGGIAPNQVIARSEFEVHRQMFTE